jgi:hypothetical protein
VRVGVALALATHAAVLLLFFEERRNKVVWPWNAATAALVLVIFAGAAGRAREFLPRKAVSLPALAALLFGVMPVLSFFGLWGHYLSAALYSGNTAHGELTLSEPVARTLPPRVQSKLRPEADGLRLDINHWTYVELKVPAYPSERVYTRAASSLCEKAASASDVRRRAADAHARLRRAEGSKMRGTL